MHPPTCPCFGVAKIYDHLGNPLPADTPPPPIEKENKGEGTPWSPFENRPAFAFAELIFERMHASEGNVNQLLDIWAAHAILEGSDGKPIFESHQELLDTIDSIKHGDAPFTPFTVSYPGPIDETSPDWKCRKWTVWARNPHTVAHHMIANTQAMGKFNTQPYIELRNGATRVYSNLMSGDYAYQQAVRLPNLLYE